MNENNVQQHPPEGDPLAREALRALFRASDARAAQLVEQVERVAEGVERLDLTVQVEPARVSCNHERAGGIYWLPDNHNRVHAEYRHVTSGERSTLDVVAVNELGEPLVWTDQGLELARTAGGNYVFDHVHEGDDRWVAIVSGGGWMAEHRQDDGEVWTEPVLAWIFDRCGYGSPVFTDGEGWAEPEKSRGARFFHPDETTTPAGTPAA